MINNPNRWIISLTCVIINLMVIGLSIRQNDTPAMWFAVGCLFLNAGCLIGNLLMRDYIKEKSRQDLIDETIGK